MTAWKEPIGLPNWLAHLRVRDRRGEHGLAEPEAVARDGDRRPVVQTANRCVGVAVEPEHL